MKNIVLILLRIYRRWLSPLKRTPTCRYLPTCSEYAHDAVVLHGALKGTAMAIGRLLRCHPFCRGGYDPVRLPKGMHR